MKSQTYASSADTQTDAAANGSGCHAGCSAAFARAAIAPASAVAELGVVRRHSARPMKLDGFRLHSIYLDTDSESFDLHNCFDFVGLDYDVSSRTLRLRWTPSAYAPAGERRSITVTFHQVTHFSAAPRDPEMPFTEDDCLEGIYFTIPGTDLSAYLEPGTVPPLDSPYVFCFMSGFSLRVLGESAQHQLQ